MLIRSHSICVGGRCEPQSWSGLADYYRHFDMGSKRLKKRNLWTYIRLFDQTKNRMCLPDDDVLKSPTSKSGGGVFSKILQALKLNWSSHTDGRHQRAIFTSFFLLGITPAVVGIGKVAHLALPAWNKSLQILWPSFFLGDWWNAGSSVKIN